MSQSILDFFSKFIDLNATINFNGVDMTLKDILSSPENIWIILIFVAIPLILMCCFIYQGIKRKKYANMIDNNKGETMGEVVSIFWKQTNKRSHNEATQGTNYAKISYSVDGSLYHINTVAKDLGTQEQVKVFYDVQDPTKALIERDYYEYKKASGFKYAGSFLLILSLLGILFALIVYLANK